MLEDEFAGGGSGPEAAGAGGEYPDEAPPLGRMLRCHLVVGPVLPVPAHGHETVRVFLAHVHVPENPS